MPSLSPPPPPAPRLLRAPPRPPLLVHRTVSAVAMALLPLPSPPQLLWLLLLSSPAKSPPLVSGVPALASLAPVRPALRARHAPADPPLAVAPPTAPVPTRRASGPERPSLLPPRRLRNKQLFLFGRHSSERSYSGWWHYYCSSQCQPLCLSAAAVLQCRGDAVVERRQCTYCTVRLPP